MNMNVFSHWMVYGAGAVLARMIGWSPLHRLVVIHIEASGDRRLKGKYIRGSVLAWGNDKLLIYLRKPMAVSTHSGDGPIDLVALIPVSPFHRPLRLILASAAVDVIAAPTFADVGSGRLIGTGRVQLLR